jgi:hypothetical protein
MVKMIYEIFEEFKDAPTRADKIDVLRKNNSFALRTILQGSFDPVVKFTVAKIPDFYMPSDSPPGMGYSNLHVEIEKAYLFEENNPKVSPNLTQKRKEEILVSLLEILEAKEANIFIGMILKKQDIADLDADLVKEAFPGLIS